MGNVGSIECSKCCGAKPEYTTIIDTEIRKRDRNNSYKQEGINDNIKATSRNTMIDGQTSTLQKLERPQTNDPNDTDINKHRINKKGVKYIEEITTSSLQKKIKLFDELVNESEEESILDEDSDNSSDFSYKNQKRVIRADEFYGDADTEETKQYLSNIEEIKKDAATQNIAHNEQVKLKVIPNISKSGYIIKILTFDTKYNRQYNFPSNATLFDFLHRWEEDFGIDIGKNAPRYEPEWFVEKTTQIIKRNINSDTLLKDLANNKDIEWHSFQPGYENNIIRELKIFDTMLNNNEYKQKMKKRGKMSREPLPALYPVGIVLNLRKLFENDESEYDKFKWCIKNRGWILIEYEEKYQNDIMKCSQKIKVVLEEYMKYKNNDNNNNNNNDDDEWKTICDNFGFTNFKDYKSVLRIYTNKMFKLFANEYPNNIIEAIEKISDIMDEISLKILNKTLYFWLNKENKKDDKVKIDISELDELCLNDDGFGMIDYVLYKNNKMDDDEKYNMLEAGHNVDSHIDPGLFSLSFFQFNKGLQVLDRYPREHDDKHWIRIPEYIHGKYGILWTGQYSSRTNKWISSGIHRVDYNDKKPRFTGWYEVCINNQIPNKLIKKYKNENGSQQINYLQDLVKFDSFKQKMNEINSRKIIKMIKLKIKPMDTQFPIFIIEINENLTILDLKNKIYQESPDRIIALRQRLIHKGRLLKDIRTLKQYNISNEESIMLVRSSRNQTKQTNNIRSLYNKHKNQLNTKQPPTLQRSRTPEPQPVFVSTKKIK